MQDLLETVLEIVNTLSIDFLYFLALVCELRPIIAGDLLDGDGRLMDECLDTKLQLLQLLLLLL